MANEYYITAGLPAIDSADIASVATNAFYITAGLPANDYVAGATENKATKFAKPAAIMRGMLHHTWLDADFLKPTGGL